MALNDLVDRMKRKRILQILRKTNPEKFEDIGKRKLMDIIKIAQSYSPAYKDVVQQYRKDFNDDSDPQHPMQQLPVLNKENYFNRYTLNELAGKRSKDIKLAMTSSGFSGNFAYGFSSKQAYKDFKLGVDTSFDYCFDISNRRTFLINCEPMGVHVETSLSIAETSVRSDMAIALLKKVSPLYDQTLILGDPYFMKKLIEEGTEAGINWKKLGVSIITGQDWLPESLRTYMANLLQIDLENDHQRTVITTMGMTELGINVFHESNYLIALRRACSNDHLLKNALTNTTMKAPPMFYHYYPFRTYIETQQKNDGSELLFSSLDRKGIIPVIRYSTGDSGKVLTYNELKQILKNNYSHLIPDLKLPIGIIYGRSKNRYVINDISLHLEDIKEALFNSKEVAASITGLISIDIKTKPIQIHVHLKPGIQRTKGVKHKIEQELSDYLAIEISAQIHLYHEFPGALELSYERKLFSSL